MKNLKLSILSIAVLFTYQTHAQSNWDNIDFAKEYKVGVKIQGSVAKSLKNNPTFINDYYVEQASLQKGASRAGTLQKQGTGSVFAEAALAGVTPEALQSLIDELHENFVTQLKNAGLNITNGDELLQTKYAQSKKQGKNVIVGKTDGKFIYDKGGVVDLRGSDIKEKYLFRPEGKNVFVKNGISANFYQNLASKETVNMISIGYTIRFASFDGKKSGLSKNSLTTSAGLMITPKITLVNPKGSFSWITYDKAIMGNNEWSKGLVKKGSRDGSFWGLSSSADYAIEADQEKYIDEVKSIVINLQKDIAKQIKSTF